MAEIPAGYSVKVNVLTDPSEALRGLATSNFSQVNSVSPMDPDCVTKRLSAFMQANFLMGCANYRKLQEIEENIYKKLGIEVKNVENSSGTSDGESRSDVKGQHETEAHQPSS
jgi:hypothetical protein